MRRGGQSRQWGVTALAAFVVFVGCAQKGEGPARTADGPPGLKSEALLDDIQARTFRFFWETTHAANGLAVDRYPTPSFSSVAAIGFALTAYGVGVERGWVSREAARDRVLVTLRFLAEARQSGEENGATGFRGFFYHFLDVRTGARFKDVELSTVDTALLMAGVLFCQSYFDAASTEEAEIRRLAEQLYRRVDWRWAQKRSPAIALSWKPETGFKAYDWVGYNEAMLVYLLALASPSFPVEPDAWQAWTGGYDRAWGTAYGLTHLRFGPHFGHQYSHIWYDFRRIQDAYMRARGSDYFENSRRATYAQRAYAVANPRGWKGYSEDIWGLTACDGPGRVERAFAGRQRSFFGYRARGIEPDSDDGTLAPTAVVASLPFAPEIVMPAIETMLHRYGKMIFQEYGFLDAFNPSFTFPDAAVHGRVERGLGWVGTDYLGIDQGPILLMIENYRSGLVWRVMRRNAHVRRGLRRAGFIGGWLEEAS